METLSIAMAGNANVGKSVLFNNLTGMQQHVANWPGKTVEIATGKSRLGNYELEIADLPGIYSFSTFSIEERIARDYIVEEKPEVVINVVNSTALERNLFFTIQLLELGVPLVVALNQIDLAKKEGISINAKKLGGLLNVEVVPTIATKGFGVRELIGKCILIAKKKRNVFEIKYGSEIESRIERLTKVMETVSLKYPARYAAIKLLEEDEEITKEVAKTDAKVIKEVEKCTGEIEEIHGEPSSIVIRNERYAIAARIAESVQTISERRESIGGLVDELTTHRVFGYVIMFLLLGIIFYSIFTFGVVVSSWISNFFSIFRPSDIGPAGSVLWEGVVGGFVAGITLVLPYVLPFYLLLSLLEDTGYIARIAYLLDGLAHRIGFHGKAIIPLILGYGCNVPACFGCRIMEYERDRFITAFAVTLVPCTARTVVILALVAAYLGIWWALAIYLLNIVIVAILAKIAFKLLPGEPVGLIMEMPTYKMPSLSTVAKQTWRRIKSIITMVFPYYVFGGLVLGLLQILGILQIVNMVLEPVTVQWLGLPAFVGTLLIFGIVRKELVVVMPAILFGVADLNSVFTPVQMIVLTIVTMLYVPCLATLDALKREFGLEKAVYVAIFEVFFAVILGGVIYRLLTVSGLV